jgi:riboflavin kinase/FMN adenylyltransferase
MNIVTSIKAASRIRRGIVLSIGNFDGLHRAHAKILGWAVAEARRTGGEAWALTFSNHPLEVLKGRRPSLLTTTKEKIELLRGTGLDGVLLLRFTKAFSRLTGRDFIRALCGRMKVRTICVGGNFLFGSSNKGDAGLLRRTGLEFGFRLKSFPVLRDRRSGAVISSSEVRVLLAKGLVDDANRLLGRPYSVTATVVKGRRLGRKIGFPTLNFDPKDPGLAAKLLPRHGVYATETSFPGRKGPGHRGLTFVGPNFGTGRMTVETHLTDFSGDAYGRTATVRFLKFIRPPRVFRSEEALRQAIRDDINISRRL